MMKSISTNKQAGAVSLFVVIFFMLLVTVVTVSFVRLMVADQRQATDNDLSQSAYDSAQAGVEDAKRALLQYQAYCSTHTSTECAIQANSSNLTSGVCNQALNNYLGIGAASSGSGSTGKTAEIKVQTESQSSTTDTAASLDQAYTCTTIQLQTSDYIGNLTPNQSQLVPLIAANAFDRVRVEWFSKDDLTAVTGSSALDLLGAGSGQPLLANDGTWPMNRPSLMRAQLIQVAKTFTLSDFDTYNSSGQANAATMFLYPTKQSQTVVGVKDFTTIDPRKTDTAGDETDKKSEASTPTAIHCETNISAGGYACNADLLLPQTIGASGNDDRTAFLRLVPFYNATHFRVTLGLGSFDTNPVKFKDVQPEVDSTGRANDVFRRVLSRVNLYDTSFPYPEATIDVTGDFCKDFAVTNDKYIPGSVVCNNR